MNFIVTYRKLQSAVAAAPVPRRTGNASVAMLPTTMNRVAGNHVDAPF
jgi:hypothetical protein